MFSGLIAGTVAKEMSGPSPLFHDAYHFDAEECALKGEGEGEGEENVKEEEGKVIMSKRTSND